MKVKLIVEGGKMQIGPAVAQQLGPLGINLGKVASDVNSATSNFDGIKVPVELSIDPKTKKYTITVFSPPVAESIKKELGLEKGSGQPNKIKVGNIAVESLIKIAKTKEQDLLAKNTKSALKLIVGSCTSLGVLVDNKEPKEIMQEIDAGKYDKEIKNEITSVSEEKKAELKEFFKIRKEKQDKALKALEEAKAAQEAQAAATATPGAAVAAATATPGAAAQASGKVAAAPKKEEAKKSDAKKEEPKKEKKK